MKNIFSAKVLTCLVFLHLSVAAASSAPLVPGGVAPAPDDSPTARPTAVLAVPTITRFAPATGPVGTRVTVTGTGFTGATSVVLNTLTATTFAVVSATSLTFTVPAGATSGTVAITTPGGTGTSTIRFTVTAPVGGPTVTGFQPARAVAGSGPITVTVSGTSLTASTTVSFNGGTYPTTAVGTTTTSVTVTLPASGLTTVGSFPITVTNSGGTSTALNFLVVAPATSTSYEDFETGTKTGYATGTVTLRSGDWTFTAALTGNQFNDHINQVQGARLRPAGFIAMNFDKPNGAGTITVNAALYGTDLATTFKLELSTDGGTTYALVPGAPAALTATLTPYTFTVNQTGPVRLRLTNTAPATATNPRLDIDDLNITNFTLATLPGRALPGLSIYPNPTRDRLTVVLPGTGAAQVAVRDLTGRVVLPLAPLAADKVLTLPTGLASGVYLLEVRQGGETAVRRISKE